ncbi:MAG: transglycosylase SLT domain-containing protein [Hyphomonadaceae bacterium]
MKHWHRVCGAVAVLGLIGLIAAGASRQIALAQQAEPVTFNVGQPIPRPSPTEYSRLRDGMTAAASNNWAAVRQARDSATDPLVRRTLQWRYAAAPEAPADFYDLSRALRELEDWPGRATMRQRAEQAIFDSGLSMGDRVAFLRGDGGPQTGDGRVALAQALRATGQNSEAVQLVRQAWRTEALSSRAEAVALAEFSGALSEDDHAARLDISLWRGERGAAQRLMPRVSAADRAVAQARIMLQTRPRRGVQAAVDAVPASRSDDPGLLYDRARYVRRAGRPEDAYQIALRIVPTQAPLAARDDIYDERRLYIGRAMRAGNRRDAYRFANAHGMSSGEQFADAEWLAGWLSLRFLNQPREAAAHFAHLDENVSTPVSRARALYWRAEAARALGDTAEADQRLAEAARYDYVYYGQLAAARRGGVMRLADNSPAPTQEVRQRFQQRELVRALRLISEFGTQREFEMIAYYLDDTLDDPAELELLGAMARESSYTRTALRTAKAGIRRGILAVNAAFPLLDLPAEVRSMSRPEPALVYAIIRQESEFDPRAMSPVGARGLMQLMPATARLTANRYGLPYQLANLTGDPQYNIRLGASHLSDLLDEFGGSYVLVIAAYNAGGGRAREWIRDFGDPRSSTTDVVDWVELVPFAETRNYIQRVLENVQVYRHRLSGQPTPIQIQQDLRRGST